MKNNENILDTAKAAFPSISNATFVRRLASQVPLAPDTTFDIYVKDTKDFIALVATDYADPQHQSWELKSISGKNEFEFINLIKPYSNNEKTTEVLDNDDMEGNFFVTIPYKNYHLYCYLANLKLND